MDIKKFSPKDLGGGKYQPWFYGTKVDGTTVPLFYEANTFAPLYTVSTTNYKDGPWVSTWDELQFPGIQTTSAEEMSILSGDFLRLDDLMLSSGEDTDAADEDITVVLTDTEEYY